MRRSSVTARSVVPLTKMRTGPRLNAEGGHRKGHFSHADATSLRRYRANVARDEVRGAREKAVGSTSHSA